MKKLFPLLLCYALTTSQCFAISGGPVYGNGSVSVVGAYSGIIQGVSESDPSSNGPAIPGDPVPGGTNPATSSNALGLFDLVVPGTTTATGAFLLFADGIIFGGTIDASVDPDSAKISGILSGAFNFNVTTFDALGASTTTAVTASAVGSISAKINAPGSHAATFGRLTGTAFLDVSFGGVNADLSPVVARTLTFTVSGFKTTTVASALASALGTATGSTGPTGGSGG